MSVRIAAMVPSRPDTFRHASLTDLMLDGFHVLTLLGSGHAPLSESSFRTGIRTLLDEFDAKAREANASLENIAACKYAFCATLDEIILSSSLPLRNAWERAPLQLSLFGDQLAGTQFFSLLDRMRLQGPGTVEVLEVFHLCLLAGFRGRYGPDEEEQRVHLIATLDKEILLLRGGRAPFAPDASVPAACRHRMRRGTPMWMIAGSLALAGALTFISLYGMLDHRVRQVETMQTAQIRPLPPPAHIEIQLP